MNMLIQRVCLLLWPLPAAGLYPPPPPKSNRRINNTNTNACQDDSRGESFPYPRDSYIDLFRPQRNSDEAAGEVSLLLFQQVFALVQSDVEQSCPMAGVSGWLELQGDLELPHREVVAEIVGDGGDGAERVGGHRAVKLGHPGGIQLPAHQLQVTQVPETVRSVAQGQAGFAAGCGGGSPMVVGSHSLQEKRVKVNRVLTKTFQEKFKLQLQIPSV